MSRVVKNNEEYSFVFGLDHITGPFFQIWKQPADEQDCAMIVADNMGTYGEGLTQEDTSTLSTETLKTLYYGLRDRYAKAQRLGNHHPNLDAQTICDFAKACGFDDLYMEIADVLDNPP